MPNKPSRRFDLYNLSSERGSELEITDLVGDHTFRLWDAVAKIVRHK